MARAVLAADPDAARRRHAQAVRERTVRFSPGPDGMASLWARLSAEDALGCYRELCELADTATPPDPAATGSTGLGPAGGSGTDDRTPDDRLVDDRTADARRADTLIDLIMGAAATQHPDEAAANHCPLNPARPAADNAHPHAAPPAATGSTPPQARANPARARIDVTVAWTTLAGLNDQPGHLHGYGPIHAEVARELAADATWQRLLTDPDTGTVHDVGTTRYTPPAAMAAHIRARDRTCRWYGCRQPATRCDLDHPHPYPHGPTATTNSPPSAAHTTD